MAKQHKALYGDGSKRIRPEGCWSFCGKPGHCNLEKIGACRKFVPRIECPPPNQGCQDIHALVFGKRDYDKEIAEWERRRNQLVDRRSQKFPVETIPDWRPPDDPFAMIPIFIDPRRFLSGQREELWNPDEFQESILTSSDLIVAIGEAGKYDYDPFETKEFQDLRGKLLLCLITSALMHLIYLYFQ